jgi:hypothetical protein
MLTYLKQTQELVILVTLLLIIKGQHLTNIKSRRKDKTCRKLSAKLIVANNRALHCRGNLEPGEIMTACTLTTMGIVMMEHCSDVPSQRDTSQNSVLESFSLALV